MAKNQIKEGLKEVGLTNSGGVKELRERAAAEGFKPGSYATGSFGIAPDRISFIQTVYTGYLTDAFYKSREDTIRESLALQKAMATKEPKFHAQVIAKARNEASIKDQVLIGVWANKKAKNVIKTLPPTTIAKLIDFHKKYGIKTTTAKNIISTWLKSLDPEKLDFYATKNKKVMQRLIKYVHETVSDDTWTFIRKTSKYKGKNKLFKAVKDIAAGKAPPEGVKIPYEVIRASGKKIPFENITFTSYQLLSFAKSLADGYGETKVAKALENVNGKYITSDKWFIAALAVNGTYNSLAKVMFNKYKESIETSYEKLLVRFGKKPKFTILFDTSGSMSGSTQKCLAMIVPFYKLIENFYTFDTGVTKVNTILLTDIPAALEALSASGGTALFDSIRKIKDKLGETDLIIVTDEQENASDFQSNSAVSEIVKAGHNIYLVNPMNYKDHTLLKGITFLPAKNAEALASVIKLNQLKTVTQKDITKYFEKPEEDNEAKTEASEDSVEDD